MLVSVKLISQDDARLLRPSCVNDVVDYETASYIDDFSLHQHLPICDGGREEAISFFHNDSVCLVSTCSYLYITISEMFQIVVKLSDRATSLHVDIFS